MNTVHSIRDAALSLFGHHTKKSESLFVPADILAHLFTFLEAKELAKYDDEIEIVFSSFEFLPLECHLYRNNSVV